MIHFKWGDDIPWWLPPVVFLALIIMGIQCASNGSATVSEPDAPTPMIETMEEQQW